MRIVLILGFLASMNIYGFNAKDYFDKMPIRAHVGDDVDGVGVHVGVEVLRNADLKSYSRYETVGAEIIGDFVGDYYGVKFGPTAKSQFIRKFSKKSDAINFVGIKPKNPLQLPLKSQYALEHMSSGKDAYRLIVKMGLDISPLLNKEKSNISAGVKYYLFGDFQIDIYRKVDGKFLVRASSVKEKGYSLFLKASDQWLEASSRILKKLIPNPKVELTFFEKGEGHIFAVAYEYDLTKPKGKEAYDNFLSFANWDPRDLEILRYTTNFEKAKKILKSRVRVTVETSKSHPQAVKQVGTGVSRYVKKQQGNRINLVFAKSTHQQKFEEQLFSYQKGREKPQQYLISSLISENGYSLLFDLLYGKEVSTARVVFAVDDGGVLNRIPKIQRVAQLIFSYKKQYHKLKRTDSERIDQRLNRLTPEALQTAKNALLEKKGATGTRRQGYKTSDRSTLVEYDYIMDGQLWSDMSSLNAQEIESVINKFMVTVAGDADKYGKIPYEELGANTFGSNDKDRELTLESLKTSRYSVVGVLATVFSPQSLSTTEETRWKSLKTLLTGRYSEFFNYFGPGIFTRLAYEGARKRIMEDLIRKGVSGAQLNNRLKQQLWSFFSKRFNIKMKVSHSGNEKGVRGLGATGYQSGELYKVLEERDRINNRNYDISYFDDRTQ